MIGEIINKPGAITITDKKGSRLQDNPVDLRHLIRSVQRLEGNPDCFQTAKEHCDQKGCVWRVYCLEEPLFMKGLKDEGQGGEKS